MNRRPLLTPLVLALLFAVAAAAPVSATGNLFSDRARQAVREAFETAPNPQAIPTVLASMAWPSSGEPDAEIGAAARAELVGFGHAAIRPLTDALRDSPTRFGADIVAAMVEARLLMRSGVPPDYLPGLEVAVWFGGAEAKRVAIRELGSARHIPAQLACIDAAYDHPQLTDSVILALGFFRDHRGRFFLEEQLASSDPTRRRLAAEALVEIGGLAFETLRNAILSDNSDMRGTALDTLLPHSSGDDLTVLYEFVARHQESDPERVERVLRRASHLEALLEAQTEQHTKEALSDF